MVKTNEVKSKILELHKDSKILLEIASEKQAQIKVLEWVLEGSEINNNNQKQ